MLTNKILDQLPFDGLKTKKLVSNETGSIILISLEKESVLASHVSNTDATIIVLEGAIVFTINDNKYNMEEGDMYTFKKDEIHELSAINDSKIILIK